MAAECRCRTDDGIYVKGMRMRTPKETYNLIGWAAARLKDDDWIISQYDGNIDWAVDGIMKEHFPDVIGFTTLSQLIRVYEEVDESEWRKRDYNLAAAHAILEIRDSEERAAERPRGPRRNWKKEYGELQEKYVSLEHDLQAWKELASEREQEISRLKTNRAASEE